MIAFNDMPAHSRVWIYQSEREFSSAETERIKSKAEGFVEQWTSHNTLMHASIEVFHNLFVVVCVDERTAPASGCGIDKSVRFVQELEKELQISLLDRMVVAYRKDGKVLSCKLPGFGKLIEEKKAGEATIVFNNLVSTKGEMEKGWEVPLKESWHARMLISR